MNIIDDFRKNISKQIEQNKRFSIERSDLYRNKKMTAKF